MFDDELRQLPFDSLGLDYHNPAGQLATVMELKNRFPVLLHGKSTNTILTHTPMVIVMVSTTSATQTRKADRAPFSPQSVIVQNAAMPIKISFPKHLKGRKKWSC